MLMRSRKLARHGPRVLRASSRLWENSIVDCDWSYPYLLFSNSDPGQHSTNHLQKSSRKSWEIEKPPVTVMPAGVKEQEGQDVVNLLPKLSGDVRAPISLRKPGLLFIGLALLISLVIGTSFLSRARSHPAAYTASPTSRIASPASTPTSATVASSNSTVARTYAGTIYDLKVNASTSMSLTGIQQNQGSFSGYIRLGPKMKGSGLFRGTIDTTQHLQFTVPDAAGNATLFFEGAMQSATSLSGDYYQCSPGPIQGGKCSQAPGGFGIWNVARA